MIYAKMGWCSKLHLQVKIVSVEEYRGILNDNEKEWLDSFVTYEEKINDFWQMFCDDNFDDYIINNCVYL